MSCVAVQKSAKHSKTTARTPAWSDMGFVGLISRFPVLPYLMCILSVIHPVFYNNIIFACFSFVPQKIHVNPLPREYGTNTIIIHTFLYLWWSRSYFSGFLIHAAATTRYVNSTTVGITIELTIVLAKWHAFSVMSYIVSLPFQQIHASMNRPVLCVSPLRVPKTLQSRPKPSLGKSRT